MQILITTLASAASSVLILLLGQWTARAQKRRDDEKGARAALRRDYESLLAAMARFRMERVAHLKVRMSWRARGNVAMRAVYESLAAYEIAATDRSVARFRAVGPAIRYITDWRQRVDEQELSVLGPMNEVVRAAIPLAGSDFEQVASATNKVLGLLPDDDDEAMDRALAVLRRAILDAEAAMQKRRRFPIRRRRPALVTSETNSLSPELETGQRRPSTRSSVRT
ncbi:hypothetical protein ABIA32_002709 [Streptacidiphilus sp. MAP12-20]|uniref:hypothetical protein n=1 Tax=Streptacidiphilus sp. MAP12-20 TaxID=3156299 RepID=UPI003511B712